MSAPFHWCHSHDVTNGVTAWPYAATYGFVMTIPRLFFFLAERHPVFRARTCADLDFYRQVLRSCLPCSLKVQWWVLAYTLSIWCFITTVFVLFLPKLPATAQLFGQPLLIILAAPCIESMLTIFSGQMCASCFISKSNVGKCYAHMNGSVSSFWYRWDSLKFIN